MAKWVGVIGYGVTVRKDGIAKDVIVERPHRGEILREARQMAEVSEQIVNDISVNTAISILSDKYLMEHYFAIKYISWMGSLWTVQKVDVRAPRLNLRLGKVYNGPKADPPPETPGGDSSV